MRLGVLFSGGKDSAFAAYLAKKEGYTLSCLITLESKNQDSFMFHTPSIDKTKVQAKVMDIPLITQKTKGMKESELKDLEKAIKKAKDKYNIEGIVTGAVESVYQASRIQKICNKLSLEVFNPLWQKNQIELLTDVIKHKFEVIITAIAGEGLDESWLGRRLDKVMIANLKGLQKRYAISPSLEGGEGESFVLDCPLFKRKLKVVNEKISGEGHAWRMEVEVK